MNVRVEPGGLERQSIDKVVNICTALLNGRSAARNHEQQCQNEDSGSSAVTCHVGQGFSLSVQLALRYDSERQYSAQKLQR